MWLRYSPAHTNPPSTKRNAHRAHHTHRAHHELSESGAVVAPRRHVVTATPTEGRLRSRTGSEAGREREARRAGSGKQGGPGAGSEAAWPLKPAAVSSEDLIFDPESRLAIGGG